MNNIIDKIKKFEREIIFTAIFGVVVTSLIAFWGDLGKTVGEILSFNWRLIPLILALTSFNYLLRFLRWHFFLKKINFRRQLSLKESGLIFLSGLPLTLTPGKTGEILKAYFLKKIAGDHLSRTIPVVVIERLTDGLAALVLLSFSFYSYPFGHWAMFFIFFSSALFLFFIYHRQSWNFFLSLFSKMKKKRSFFSKIERKLFSFHQALLDLVGIKSLLGTTGLAAVAWSAEAVGFALIIASFTHQPLSGPIVSKAIFIFCFVSILGFVSFLPGGLGVAEGGFVGMLILLFSLSSPRAAAATILLRLFTLWWGVSLGFVALLILLRSFKKDG